MKLYHPTIPGNTVEVPDANVEDWTEQGWRKTAPRASGGRVQGPSRRLVGDKGPELFTPKDSGTVVPKK